MGHSRFAYTVDAADRVVSVSPDWEAFARENQAEHLCGAVVGQLLFDFITDPETRALYEMILARVRREQRGLVVPFRCDSPTLRRFMELDVSPEADGGVQFEGRIVRQETRPPVALFDTAFDRTDEFVCVCSWCKRVDASGEWVEVEEAVTRLHLFDTARLPRLTHGICAACLARLQGEFDG